MIKRIGGLAAAALLASAGFLGLPATAQAASTDIVVNEVESNGGTPGDWFELYNKGTAPVDLSGWTMLDSDDTHTPYAFPAGTTLAPSAHLVVEEAQFGFGLGGGDSVRVFDPAKTQIAVYSWTAHAATGSWQRMPDGTGTTWVDAVATKGTANAAGTATPTPTPTPTPSYPAGAAWPGAQAVTAVDAAAQYTGDLSGLDFSADGTALWAVNNGASLLYKLDPANNHAPFAGWETGKAMTYLDGTGRPDTEGVTVGPGGKLYLATERNNADNKVSKLVILEIDPTTGKTTNEWDLTGGLPATGPNLGMEAIEWMPPAADEPATPGFVPGTFFIGIEGSGDVYPVMLGLKTNIFATGAAMHAGFPGVMALDFDAATNQLWVFCDDTCSGEVAVYQLDSHAEVVSGPTFYSRPTGMPNLNNEGVAMGASCLANGTRPVVGADDGDTGGNSLRVGSVACTYAALVTPAPTPAPTPTPTPSSTPDPSKPKLANTGARA